MMSGTTKNDSKKSSHEEHITLFLDLVAVDRMVDNRYLFGSVHYLEVKLSWDICSFALYNFFDSTFPGKLLIIFPIFKQLNKLFRRNQIIKNHNLLMIIFNKSILMFSQLQHFVQMFNHINRCSCLEWSFNCCSNSPMLS